MQTRAHAVKPNRRGLNVSEAIVSVAQALTTAPLPAPVTPTAVVPVLSPVTVTAGVSSTVTLATAVVVMVSAARCSRTALHFSAHVSVSVPFPGPFLLAVPTLVSVSFPGPILLAVPDLVRTGALLVLPVNVPVAAALTGTPAVTVAIAAAAAAALASGAV
eukprot:319185-Chlamydomonas_euryale.AAC.1